MLDIAGKKTQLESETNDEENIVRFKMAVSKPLPFD